MIGTDEMSSTGMDISESFRPEDLSKTDFFDFVTAPDMGIGIGVGVGVGVSLHTHHHSGTRTNSGHLTHDGGGGNGESGGGGGINNRNITNDNNGPDSGSNSDPTLQNYEFWHTDKDQSRLESTIFEDLDRYCWQQQQQQQHQQQQHTNNTSQQPQQQQQQQQQHPASNASASPNTNNNNNNIIHTSTSHTNSHTGSSSTSGSISQPGSTGTVSSIDNTDGQIYTITVLNGNEPWLKREPDTQLPSTLDLDSLLGNFSGYIKSEYPYDDSGFGTDGAIKDTNTSVISAAESNGMSMAQMSTQHHDLNGMGNSQTLPSLVTAIARGNAAGGGNSALGGGGGSGGIVTNAISISQQLAQFQNNNNDWHMADHNADQNSAESLLRSALQGKGYAKGLHMQNGITLMQSSPTVKDDEMRRILFPTDTDTLGFADSSLNAAQIFDDTQNATHNPHLVMQHSPVTNGPLSNAPDGNSGVGSNTGGSGVPSIMVDDMFLSLESDYNDDYEKIKRIANEVQHFCTADYPSSADMLMQISPSALASNVNTTQMQQMHSPATTPTGIGPAPVTASLQPNTLHLPTSQQSAQKPPQTLKAEVSTVTGRMAGATATGGVHKTAKKYKRLTSTQHTNNNNNNSSIINHNNNNNNSSGSTSNVSGNVNVNGNPTHSSNSAAGGSGNGSAAGASSGSSTNSSNSPTHCNGGQRKERSLHYCSICSKGFKDKYSVNVHIRTHTGEKPFACSLCGKSFRQKAHLAKHYQTHIAQKNNGSIVKSSSSNKHRNATSASVTAVGSASSATSVNAGNVQPTPGTHRQLSATPLNVNVGTSSSGGVPVGMGVGVGVGVTGILSPSVMSLSVPNASNVLPPANGLLTNR